MDKEKAFKGKKILVTGGAGSIGKEIVKNLLKFRPNVVRVFDNNESESFKLQQELEGEENVRFFMGDVRDKDRLLRAMEEIDIVFHAAALKHVPMCEYNPFEAIKTNVFGTQNLIEAAIQENVEKVIFVSTDKVVEPTSAMGTTKLLAEKLIIDANFYKGKKRTIFSCVRFGNVMGSNGSVIPILIDQIRKGMPVTITDPKMIRFMMSMDQAVNLIFEVVDRMKGGEIFIFKMPTVRIGDLADIVIEETASKFGLDPAGIKRKIIGIRPGEKEYENLMTEYEARHSLETENMFIMIPKVDIHNLKLEEPHYPGAYMIKSKDYKHDSNTLLSKSELRKLLKKENLI